MKYKLLSVGVDAKSVKGEKYGYLTGLLYLAPHTLAGGATICPFSTAGCRAVCLYSSGRGGMSNVQQARIRKTQRFLADPKLFAEKLVEDIEKLARNAKVKGMTPAVRLNATSDCLWENQGIMQALPQIQFYEYTKYPATLRQCIPANLHLTYSFSEKLNSGIQALAWKSRGVNTAVVFRGALPQEFRPMPEMDYGLPVVNGDLSDLRFLDARGVIVGLKAKGQARSSEIGRGHFVQEGWVAA